MGCGLPKLKRSEDNSPGKIYSTLKRPQVETKVGVAYTYRFLDFILGKEGSGLCISSLRELPGQLQDLYQQGFVLAAVHPFIHPCGPEPTSIQRQLYRAVLIRLSDSVEKTQSNCEHSYLEMDLCLSADQLPNTDLIQGYVKKIQDAAEQGVMFVGFVQQPGTAPAVTAQGSPEDTTQSLHSSPSSVLAKEIDPNGSPKPQGGSEHQDCAAESGTEGRSSACAGEEALREGEIPISDTANGDSADSAGVAAHQDEETTLPDSSSPASQPNQHQVAVENNTPMHNNNKAKRLEGTETKTGLSSPKNGMEVFALFNHPGVHQGLLKYYTVKVPLRVHLRDEGVSGVEANWLDHMTQHFNSGASLVDGFFHLGNENDAMPKSVESVFIFQEGLEGDSAAVTPYDAIVVEQWTVINGVEVKTDYIPLLQSLAMYGWKLTCVLPTPIVKNNSDGSLATKQIVFLQRPTLPRKKRESKKLGFKTRSKSNKNSIKDVPKNKRKKNAPPMAEKEAEEQKMSEDEERMCKEESEKVVKKNNDNREKERQNLEIDSKEEKESGIEAEFTDREGGTAIETQEQKETGIEERQEGRPKTEEEKKGEAGPEQEAKDGGPKAEKEKEGVVESAEGREGVADTVANKDVALTQENQEELESTTTGKHKGEATEKQGRGAEDGQGIKASEKGGEGPMEGGEDCEGAVQVSDITLEISALPEPSSTDDPPTSID